MSGLFSIEINYPSRRSYPQYEEVFTKAAKIWMSIIREPPITLRITVRVRKVLEGQILGQAGPTEGIRIGKKVFPVAGVMEYDVIDVEQMWNEETLLDAVLDDMGHVLGIGCLWDDYLELRGSGGIRGSADGKNGAIRGSGGRIRGSASGKNTAIRGSGGGLRGSSGVKGHAWRGSSGGGLRESTSGLTISGGGLRASGGCEGHWRETAFHTELTNMTEKGGVDATLRRLTIGRLEDLGYGVDPSKAENTVVPSKFKSFLNLGARPAFKVFTPGKAKL